MREIELTKGQVAIVDDEDYEWLNQWDWYAQKTGKNFYAVRKPWIQATQNCAKLYLMHREILKPEKNLVVDHINKNTLDNRRSNIRICTQSENLMNIETKSGHKGVFCQKRKLTKKWEANIYKNRIKYYLGCFETKEEALDAYRKKAKELYGEFGEVLNGK